MTKAKIKKLITPFQTQINLYDSAKITTLTVKMKKSMNPVMPWTVLLQAKM